MKFTHTKTTKTKKITGTAAAIAIAASAMSFTACADAGGMNRPAGGTARTTAVVSESRVPAAGNTISDAGNGVVSGTGNVVDGVASGAGNVVGGAANGVGDVVGGVARGVGDVVGGVANGVGDVVGGVANGVGSAVNGVANGVGSTVNGVGRGTNDVVGGTNRAVGNVTSGTVGNVTSGTNDTFGTGTGSYSNKTDNFSTRAAESARRTPAAGAEFVTDGLNETTAPADTELGTAGAVTNTNGTVKSEITRTGANAGMNAANPSSGVPAPHYFAAGIAAMTAGAMAYGSRPRR